MNNTFTIKYLYSGIKLKDLPISEIPEIAVVGRSNVGKSSLINFLAGQKRLAFVSQTPGRTQAINIFAEIHEKFYIADLPGYGFAKSSREVSSQWAENIQEYFKKRKNICGVFFLVDVRRKVTEEDINLAEWFKSLGIRVLVVQTKCDKVNKSEIIKQQKIQSEDLGVSAKNMVSISVQKKIGLDNLCSQFISLAKIS